MTEFDVGTLINALRHHPVPLAHILQLRDEVTDRSGRQNFLHAGCKERKTTGAALADPELARALRGVLIGRWPMGLAALDLWADRVLESKPTAILEYGSGVSTVVNAILMRRLHGDGRARVFTVEQGEQAGMDIRRRLETLGLGALVQIQIAPVRSVCVDAFRSEGYDLEPGPLRHFLGGIEPEMVLIDGPNGGHGVRFSALPVAHGCLADHAEVWLTDGLRDSELSTAYWWKELGYIVEPTLQMVSKGIIRAYRGPSPTKYIEASHELREAEVTARSAEYSLFRMRLRAAEGDANRINPPFQPI